MSVEEIIIQLREIQKSNGRIFDQQFFASNEAIDNAIKLLSRLENDIEEQCIRQSLYEQLAELRGKVAVYERCFTMVETYIGKGVKESYE